MRDNNTKQNILEYTQNGLDVFNYYLPYSLPMQKNFKSPFYEDSKASCNIFKGNDGIWRYKDFGDGGEGGDCFWFVAQLKGFTLKSDFPKVLDAIIGDLHLPLASPINNISYYQQYYQMPPEAPYARKVPQQTTKHRAEPTPSPTTEYSFAKKEYSTEELNYWMHFGITKGILKRYKVYSLSKFSSFRSTNGQPYCVMSSANDPIFMYDGGTSAKVYRPLSTKGRFLNAGIKSDGYAFGFEQLPTKGDVVFITGGEKDVLSLASRGFNAISFNSETSLIDTNTLDLLKRRFKHIVLCYDMDDTGIKASKQLVQLHSGYNLIRMELPLAGTKAEKDISDFFAKGNTKDDLQALIYGTLEKQLYQQTISLLKSCEIDLSNPPEESKSLVLINDNVIGSYDNLMCVTGGEGTGKSNYVSAIISGAICQLPLDPKLTLGMQIMSNSESKAVLHYDTEQSESQLFSNIKRSLKRAGLASVPNFYHSVCLTAFTRKERLQLIQDSMDMYYHRHGGIHLVVIDGIADLVRSANDEIESVAIIEELYRLAGIYNTCIVCVLHLTPGGLKLRGHLGSELQRKAAGIISIDKDTIDASLSVSKAVKVRNGDPLDVPMIQFGWDKAQGMHIFRGVKPKKEQEARKQVELRNIATEILSEVNSMSKEEFTKKVAHWLLNNNGMTDSRASKNRVKSMLSMNIIQAEEDVITLVRS